MQTTDPLAELLTHLERGGTVPLAWVTEHAADGDLRRAWVACQDPRVLFGLMRGCEVDLRATVIACAQWIIHADDGDEGGSARALEMRRVLARAHAGEPATSLIETIEAWTPGRPHGIAADQRHEASRLADLVRAHVPCPTLDQLREAYRAR